MLLSHLVLSTLSRRTEQYGGGPVVSYATAFRLFDLVLCVLAATLSWRRSTAAGVPNTLKVMYAGLAFVFSTLYLIILAVGAVVDAT